MTLLKVVKEDRNKYVAKTLQQFVSVIVNIEDLVGDGSVTYWPLFCFDLIIFVVLVLKCWSCALDNSQYKETRRGRPR